MAREKAQTKSPALSVDKLSVQFGGLLAIDSMSFDVHEGEVLSLIGPNGAGKTTAFNVITGYIRPSGGKITYRGTSLIGLKPNEVAALNVVRTFQKTSVFGGQTAFNNVLIGLHLRQTCKALHIIFALPSVASEERKMRESAREVLDFVGLGQRADELGSALAYGEQRLLEVAVALAARPNLLLLDEPVSGMNPSETANFMKLLSEIRKLGITVLLVEHDMKMVMGVSDRIIVLNHGSIIANGSPAEIQNNPDVIRAYLGERYRKRKSGAKKSGTKKSGASKSGTKGKKRA
jgi:branched-chain amino acid transport system ATP-binding protein